MNAEPRQDCEKQPSLKKETPNHNYQAMKNRQVKAPEKPGDLYFSARRREQQKP
ncbi:hypothetical protein KSS93_10495 [Pseudomonas xanthosomatis]|uniref:hypothetical protein n=1 Tax=Pseudomonas xanthosomatis TaxID=2842356 RepID=UPI001C3E5AB7|nr:hypothetical protein [Pseudomonas xanthosomatis]QXH48314.1 hypothetical protein KSS93_10495 [Pseudomonas xanthosomatis]